MPRLVPHNPFPRLRREVAATTPFIPDEPIPPPPALSGAYRNAEADVDYKAQAESLLRQVTAKDKRIAELEARVAAPADVAVPTPLPVDGVERIDTALDANLRDTNQRLRANLRAAEAMIALRDGVSVDELTVPWPKQTPARAATRA